VTHDFESPVTVSSYDTDSPYAFTIEYSDDSSTWAPPRYHLAPASTSACDYGVDVDQAGCEAAVAALAAAAGETPGNSMQTSSTSQCQNDGSWGLVPNRCSAQTGGDWAAHFKLTSTTCEGHLDYQRVCAATPPPPPPPPSYCSDSGIFGVLLCTGGSTCDAGMNSDNTGASNWNCCGAGNRAACPLDWTACNDLAGNGVDFSCWLSCTGHGDAKCV